MSNQNSVPKNFMAFLSVRRFLITIVIVASLKGASGLVDPLFGNLNSKRFPAIFNFGDSYSDTGSYSATVDRVPYPCGMTYFGKPSGRLCDGRLIIDFLAEKLGLPYLSAYLDAMTAEFKYGVNFAVAGSTIKPVDGELYAQAANPLSLNIQLLQFQQFKQRVDELYKQDGTSVLKNRLPKPKVFSNALYTIDMGSNDIMLLSTFSRDQAHASLPAELVNYISQAIEKLHQLGGRSFLIHNVGPIGCLPNTIENYKFSPENLDEIGCVKFVNELSQVFNRLLKEKVSELRTKLQDSSLFYVDMYSAKYSLIRDANQLGFTDRLGYCCKDCKKYYIPLWMKHISNETANYKACNGPSKYISWDGALIPRLQIVVLLIEFLITLPMPRFRKSVTILVYLPVFFELITILFFLFHRIPYTLPYKETQ